MLAPSFPETSVNSQDTIPDHVLKESNLYKEWVKSGPVQATKTHTGTEMFLYSFSTTALDRGEWLTSHIGLFTPLERAPSNPHTADWVEPQGLSGRLREAINSRALIGVRIPDLPFRIASHIRIVRVNEHNKMARWTIYAHEENICKLRVQNCVHSAILNVCCVYSKQIRNKKNKMEKMCEEGGKRKGGGLSVELQRERCYDYEGRRLVCVWTLLIPTELVYM